MNILSDDVKILIRKLAIPASVGTLFQTLYNIVDTYFAGKISPEALSALTKSFPIYFILIASSIGVTVAGTSLIGNSIGEKKFNKASTYFCQLIFFSIILIIFITLIGLNFSDDVFKIMGSTDEVMNLGLDYTNIIFYGSFLFIIVVAMNSLLHAEGDTKTYRNALIISFLLNIFLNPILIFGFLFIPAFGMKGIGIATIIAQSISFIIIFNKVIKSELTKNIIINNFFPKIYFLKNIFFQSMPIIISICGYSVASAIVFKYAGFSGEYAAAGYGAGTRIEQVVLLPILGINTAIITIIAQNFGAKNLLRIKQTYLTAIKYAFVIMILSSLLVYSLAELLTGLFSTDLNVIEFGKLYLQISAFVLPAYPVFFLSNGFFMALKKSEKALIANVFRNVIFPFLVFYTAVFYNSNFENFFWLWVIYNWIFSLSYLGYTFFYLNFKLDKFSTVV
ncbi:MATE family efflux transporter [Candidatus Pelagibacter sp. RS40]|uniref:MATE family efflux transporter n=1 Tax=Candidatus Pelagibacter sp. RS40 TaxID=1977865 RepID=UPI000A1649D3|nr:MATE family efflux transporter [Candidatus Pelagibacter sp. RS40]ARJ49679.1 MATE family efflux transporter [Candidatus Pelagibacter sp. RS40]